MKYLKHNHILEQHVTYKLMVKKKIRKYKIFVTVSNFNTKMACL